MKSYVDGTLTSSGNAIPDVSTYSGVAIALGNNGNGTQPGFTGVIDEVSMYDRVLTQEEVSTLFQMQ